MFPLQQAFNAAVAINHMKKLQLAHSELVLRQASIPDIRVVDLSSPTKTRKHLEPDKHDPKGAQVSGNMRGTNHMSLPTSSHVELKSHFTPLKATQSQCGAHHAPTIAEQGKHVYHSEPANLNGFVSASWAVLKLRLCHTAVGPMGDTLFCFQEWQKSQQQECADWSLLSHVKTVWRLHGGKHFTW